MFYSSPQLPDWPKQRQISQKRAVIPTHHVVVGHQFNFRIENFTFLVFTNCSFLFEKIFCSFKLSFIILGPFKIIWLIGYSIARGASTYEEMRTGRYVNAIIHEWSRLGPPHRPVPIRVFKVSRYTVNCSGSCKPNNQIILKSLILRFPAWSYDHTPLDFISDSTWVCLRSKSFYFSSGFLYKHKKKSPRKKGLGLSKNRAKVTWYGAQIQLHQQSLSMTQLNFWSTVMQSRQNQ